MADHLPIVTKDLSSSFATELALRTKRYFLQQVVKQLIDRYQLNMDSLAEHMYSAYGVCIVLEDNYDMRDVIEGVYQIFEKTAMMREAARNKSAYSSENKYEYLTIS
jgi:uncharacterized protein YlxP (DUF503 family)